MNEPTDANIAKTPLDNFLCFSIYSANQAMNRVYKSALAEVGLTYTQYLVLVLLWFKDGQLVGDLGRQLYLESNTLTPVLQRLEAMGHINRKREKSDERRVRIVLSARGKRLKQKAACVPEKIAHAAGMSEEVVRDLNKKVIQLQSALSKNV